MKVRTAGAKVRGSESTRIFPQRGKMMNRQELVDRISEKSNVTSFTTGRVLDVLIEELGEALGQGEEVKIAGFGVFYVATIRRRVQGALKTFKIPRFRAFKGLKNFVSD